MNAWWENWRNNPLIQRSHSPELRRLARRLIESYVKRGDSIERIMDQHCGFMNQTFTYPREYPRMEAISGGYLIPGNGGIRCSSRQIGVIIEHEDGRRQWDVFKLEDIYNDCKQADKPVQMRLF